MKHKIIGTLFLSICMGLSACKKQTIQTNQIETPELTPSFAIPIGYTNLNLGDIERKLDGNGLVFNQNNALFELVYRKNLFEITASDYLQIPAQTFTTSFSPPAPIITVLNGGGVGATASWQEQVINTLTFSNGEMLESVKLYGGNLDFSFTSDFSHAISIVLTSPYITSNTGIPFSTTVNLDYTGSTPVSESVSIDMSGYTFDLTRNGTTTNEIELNATVYVTNSGAPVSGSESISISTNLDLNQYDEVLGYFGQITNSLNSQTDITDFYTNFSNGTLYFADPRFELFIYNTLGVEVQNSFSSIFELADNTNVINSGSGLTNIPNLLPAGFIGDTSVLMHTIDNSNTSPSLSNLLDQGPKSVVFSTNSTLNPNGFSSNFITRDSKVWANANVILPFFLYADNFILSDTTALDLEKELKLSPEDNVTVEDVEKLTVRIITDNGLPLTSNIQIYFADSLGNVLDSLFTDVVNGENIIEGGLIDTSLPSTDPNYGKVINSVQKTTDIVLVGQKLQNLINQKSKKIIYKVKANTTDANNQTAVKFFPEYNLFVKVSAKIDFKLNLQH
ncbi:MAG: hypothetical protein ACPGU5_04045 [Lishizhenia sp.]